MLREEWEAAVDVLADEYRLRCLWFLRPGYRASSDRDRLRLLRAIETHGDREGYRRAALLREWLSRTSNGASSGS